MNSQIELFKQCFDTSDAETEIIMGYAERHGKIHFIYDGKTAVNMICVAPLEFQGFTAQYIFAVCTKSEYRRQGLFRKHLEAVVGDSPALLIPENKTLTAMYEKLGFSPIAYLEAEISAKGGAEEFNGTIEELYRIYKRCNQSPKKDFELFKATVNAHLHYGGKIFTVEDCAMFICEDIITDIFASTTEKIIRTAFSAKIGQYKAILPLDAQEILKSNGINCKDISIVMAKNMPNPQIYINTLFN